MARLTIFAWRRGRYCKARGAIVAYPRLHGAVVVIAYSCYGKTRIVATVVVIVFELLL